MGILTLTRSLKGLKVEFDMARRGDKRMPKKSQGRQPQGAKESVTTCPVCGATFKGLGGLNRHLTGKHGVKILEDIGVIGGG